MLNTHTWCRHAVSQCWSACI